MPGPSHRSHVPSSAISLFIEPARVSAMLEPWLPDPEDRKFVLRCLLDEGPAHHRGANFAILSLLGQLVEKLDAPRTVSADSVAVPMRMPPNHAEGYGEEGAFPLRIPVKALERIAPKGSPQFDAMVDCLTDGPPQHALGNAAMVCLLSALLDRADELGK